MDRERVVVAEIVRPRGLRGELIARSLTDVPERFRQLKEANARLKNGEDVSVQLTKAWSHKDYWVLKFAGIDSIEAAEAFRGADLWVRLENRGRLKDGEFFQSDLIGYRVLELASGAEIGLLEGWQQYGEAPSLMEVCSVRDGSEVLIPFVGSQCQVDLANRVIRVDLPDGLLEL